jgi:anaphase-promoting complex subunit 1
MRTAGALLVDSDPAAALNFGVPDNLAPEALASLVTGFAIACGIKFAGTLNRKAYDRVMAIARCLGLLDRGPFDFAACTPVRREQLLGIAILACSLIIAGTCDVSFLRFVRYIRRRAIMTTMQQYGYGLHALLGMAIGVVNFGKGRFTLGLSKSDAAALLLAVFPRFARTPSDNDFSMQALRHLVAVAAVPRVLEVRDVDADEIVRVFVRVGLADGKELVLKTPHVLPPFSELHSLRIEDSGYFSVALIGFPFEDERVRPIIWLKRRGEFELPVVSDVKTVRTRLRMVQNGFLAVEAERSEEDRVRYTELQIEWDGIMRDIIRFLVADSVDERSMILLEEPKIAGFIDFHGLSPSATLTEACNSDPAVMASLIPFLAPDALETVLN